MKFSQAIRVRAADPDQLIELLAEWDRGQAADEIMGYIGTRLLADRDSPGDYMILANHSRSRRSMVSCSTSGWGSGSP